MSTIPSFGLIGRKRSGKSTAADYLTATFGHSQIAFADPLRAIARNLNPLVSTSGARYADVETILGYERAKDEFPEFRRVLQVLGTEGVRSVLGESTWVDFLARRVAAEPGPFVVTDVRFPNEADLARDLGFVLVRVVRPGMADDGDLHPSETALDDYPADYTVTNDGTREGLYFRLSVIARSYVPKGSAS